jgi:ABC-2 type transport system ATP-binding protein
MASRFQRVDVEGGDELPLDEIATLPGVVGIDREEGAARIHADGDGAVRAALRLLVDRGVTAVRTSTPSLEEVYVHLIGDRGMDV